MKMKGYSIEFSPEECASARIEGVDASYKDLGEVCGRINGKDAVWALGFLEKASKGEIAVLYKKHNTRMGHRRELGGKKGRYPKKAAKIVLKLLKSAVYNGMIKGLGDKYKIIAASANKKDSYPRVASKGGWMRSDYETARVEIVLKGLEIVPKGVEVKAPKKPEEKKPEEKKEAPKEKPKEVPKEKPKEEKKPEVKKEEKPKEEPKKEPEKPKEEPKKEEKKPEAKEEKKPEPKKEAEQPAKKAEPEKTDVKKEVK